MEFPIESDSALVGCTIREIELIGDGGNVVVAIRRAGGEVIRNPKMDDVINAADRLIVLSHREDLPAVSKRAEQKSDAMVYRGAKH